MHTVVTMYKNASHENLLIARGMLWGDLNGEKIQIRGAPCICVTDSLSSTV